MFSENVVEIIKNAIKNGADIVTDTQMARSGINKNVLRHTGGEVHCFCMNEDVAKAAKRKTALKSRCEYGKSVKT